MDLEPTRHSDDDREVAIPTPSESEPKSAAEPDEKPLVRPEILAIFEARWERNEPAYRFLAEH